MRDIVTPPAQALVDIIAGLEVDGLRFTGLLWERKSFDQLPVGTVGTPTLRRTDPDEPESQLLTTDWQITYLVNLYFDLDDEAVRQAQMVAALVDFTAAIDADPSLNSTVFDSAVIEAVPFVEREGRSTIGYQIVVATLQLVHPDAP